MRTNLSTGVIRIPKLFCSHAALIALVRTCHMSERVIGHSFKCPLHSEEHPLACSFVEGQVGKWVSEYLSMNTICTNLSTRLYCHSMSIQKNCPQLMKDTHHDCLLSLECPLLVHNMTESLNSRWSSAEVEILRGMCRYIKIASFANLMRWPASNI